MADNPITVSLPQDLPTNWSSGQTIGPDGTDVGLTAQHGYNYLMRQVNAAQKAACEVGEAFPALTAASVGAEPQHIPTTALLSASGWAEGVQTVPVSGVTAGSTVFVAPVPADQEKYGASKVVCTAQGNGTLTFSCKKAPAADLTVNVVILGGTAS